MPSVAVKLAYSPPRGGIAGDAKVNQLDVVIIVDHDVFRLEVAVHHAIRVNVVEGFKSLDGDADSAVLGNSAQVEDAAQETALAPLHDHVNTRALVAAKDVHDIGMVQPFANGRLALEAVEEDGIGFHVGVGNLERNRASIARVAGAVDRGHPAFATGASIR